MSHAKQTKGKCRYCDKLFTKSGMIGHLPACQSRQEVILKADRSSAKPNQLYHLRVQAGHIKSYWLDLEVNGSASLMDLDDYLRSIWLECCGHLSQFSVGGWRGEEIDMRQKIKAVFKPGLTLTHIYDFGTSSETLIHAVEVREGKPTTNRPIALMARNKMPETICEECDQPATWLCLECIYDEDAEGTLCDKHAKNHPHDNYGEPLPLVNSPRAGMCGYTGPAIPPY